MPVQFKDYYGLLGVAKTATDSEIKTAYRKKARELHPDINKAADAEEKFKDVNEAYDVLSDAEKRKMYDRFGEDWKRYKDAGVSPDDVRGPFTSSTRGGSSTEDFEQWFTGAAGQTPPSGSWQWSENRGYEDTSGKFSDFFNLLFGHEDPSAGTRGRFSRPRPVRGDDIEVKAEITIQEALEGTGRKLTLSAPETCHICGGTGTARGATCPTCDGTGQTARTRTLEVTIPKGVRTGSRVRISGQGGSGSNGGPNGDVYLMITVVGNSEFKPDGKNIETIVHVPLDVAVLGGEAIVKTPTSRVALTIPKGTQNGKIFRLRGKGLPGGGKAEPGDLLASVHVDIPTALSPDEEKLFTQLRNLRQ